jgi:hypothetical protein
MRKSILAKVVFYVVKKLMHSFGLHFLLLNTLWRFSKGGRTAGNAYTFKVSSGDRLVYRPTSTTEVVHGFPSDPEDKNIGV